MTASDTLSNIVPHDIPHSLVDIFHSAHESDKICKGHKIRYSQAYRYTISVRMKKATELNCHLHNSIVLHKLSYL